MKPGMRMLMITSRDNNGRGGNGRSDRARSRENGMDDRVRSGGYDDMEGRFRDRRGREHYDDGRYAPMGNGAPWYGGDDDDDEEMRDRYDGAYRRYGAPHYPYVPPVYERQRREYPEMNRIGFAADDRMDREYRTTADYPRMNETEHRTSERMSGYASSEVLPKFSKQTAEEWTRRMENEDGTKGPHWTYDQAKQVLSQRSIDCDPAEFWAVLNAVYSDYSPVAKKHNVNSIDFYIDMAKAWLHDKDAQPNKAAAYYEYVVKR